jgi:hypothetical protein
MATQSSFSYDITRNRHRGSPESVKANPSDRSKSAWHSRILEYLETRVAWGGTLTEICDHFGKEKNELSGRLSELKAAKQVLQNGRRNGCAVLVHVKFKDLVKGAL